MFAVACCSTMIEGGQPPGWRSELTNSILVGQGRATIPTHASKAECHIAELRRVMICIVLVSRGAFDPETHATLR